MTLLVAGHETTATSLSWAIERLIRNPDVLQRLRDDPRPGSDAYLDASSRRPCACAPCCPSSSATSRPT